MNVGQKVRIKPDSPLARDLKIPREAQGTVTCRYRVLKDGEDAPDRLDVRFGPQVVVCRVSEGAFEVITERR